MIDQKIVIVFGLPGAGKTTLIQSALKQKTDFVRLSGGSLITTALAEQERDLLRKKTSSEILLNQEILVHNFQKRRADHADKHIIFDGHCIVKDGDNLTEIPVSVIGRLDPDYIVFIDESPEIIYQRRENDVNRPDREKESIENLKKNRALQIKICEGYSRHLGIPLTIFKPAKETGFNNFLSSVTA